MNVDSRIILFHRTWREEEVAVEPAVAAVAAYLAPERVGPEKPPQVVDVGRRAHHLDARPEVEAEVQVEGVQVEAGVQVEGARAEVQAEVRADKGREAALALDHRISVQKSNRLARKRRRDT